MATKKQARRGAPTKYDPDVHPIVARALADSNGVPQAVIAALGGSAEGLARRAAREAEAALALSARVDFQILAARNPESVARMPQVGQRLLSQLLDFQRRQNLSMAADAQATYRAIVTDVVPRVAAGLVAPEEGVAEAARRMAERGVRSVDYRGRRDRPDVAVRRHLQTLVRQSATDYTADLCRRTGVRLVEVDSHVGARPTHREWQGRVYGLDGPVEVDGVRYPGLRESGAWDGMREPNCLHSMAPYVPGRERRWGPTPDEDAGYAPGRPYELLQRLRCARPGTTTPWSACGWGAPSGRSATSCGPTRGSSAGPSASAPTGPAAGRWWCNRLPAKA